MFFRGAVAGTHSIDVITEGNVVVELKTVKEIDDVHVAATLSYLKATDLQVGLVINCAESVIRVRRVARGIELNKELPNFRETEGEDD